MSTPYGGSGTGPSYPAGAGDPGYDPGYDPGSRGDAATGDYATGGYAGRQGTGSSAYDAGVQQDYAASSPGVEGVAYEAGSTAGGSTAAPSPYPDVENESVGSLFKRLTSDVSTLMRQEVALAKAELREEAKKAGKGAGMLGGAALAGHFVLLFLSLMIMFAIGEFWPLCVGALLVLILWGIVAAVLFVMGRKQLKQVNPKPEQTMETLKEDKEWVKAQKS